MKFFTYRPNVKNLFILFLAAFLIRLITFGGFIQKNKYYKQPDSGDYHHGALSLSLGKGMHRVNDNKPIFWRTPGYPIYLSCFYDFFGIKNLGFEQNAKAQEASILFQILLSALLPIFILFLALILTKSLQIAWLTAWLSVFHLGLILSSTLLLTEALSLFFILPFFIFYFKSFYLKGQIAPKKYSWYTNIIMAALFLGIFTWIRPMGQFVSIASAFFLAILDRANWKIKIKKIAIFLLIFFLVTGGWYIRNYKLTGKCFFCPMFGLYLNTFNAPKIIRDLTGKPLTDCIKRQYAIAHKEVIKEFRIAQANHKELVTEIVHMKAALPIILAHPFLFLKDWIKESAKTAFDLYASQLVAIANNSYYYDPPEEFLTEKLQACIYKQKMNPFMRFITYLECIFAILLWIGLLAGSFIFLLYPLFKWFNVDEQIKQNGLVWLKVSPLIGSFIIMTGGFGYARLRLPVEALMIILSLTFWIWIIKKRKS